RARSASSAVDCTGATSGTQARCACLAASRTIVAHRSRPFAAFDPSQRDTLLAACHGTTSSTPSSHAAWTASSPQTPLARTSARTIRVAGCSWSRRASMRTVTRDADTSSTDPSSQVPAPSPSVMASPTRTRRTAECLASAPVSATRSPTWAPSQSGMMKCSAKAAPIVVRRSVAAEAVAQLGEQSLLELRELRAGCLRLLRELLDQLALRRVEAGRGDDLHADAEITALAAAQRGHAAPADGEHVAGLHPGAQLQVHRTVEALDRRVRAEDGIGHRDLEGREQVVALAAEHRMRCDRHLDVEVAVRSARAPDRSGSRQLQAQPGLDAGGDVERHGAPG